ncbi:hypothetical protein PR048_010672 [Dryococelus australis]|uniref:Uncharacterized protein n=1 Tax=Dryococelus australis TaxID=614101 RepID=A0ABQ9I3T7_9NEOP|nr:hypothetical protein PR048_010672 [Dryococelus australis]
MRLLSSQREEPGWIPGGVMPGSSHLVSGFSRGSPVFSTSLHSAAAPYSRCFNLIGSQDPPAWRFQIHVFNENIKRASNVMIYEKNTHFIRELLSAFKIHVGRDAFTRTNASATQLAVTAMNVMEHKKYGCCSVNKTRRRGERTQRTYGATTERMGGVNWRTSKKTPPTSGIVRHDPHMRGPGNPGCSHVGIVPDDAAGRRVFSGVSRFPRPFDLLHTHLNHPHRLLRPRGFNAFCEGLSAVIRANRVSLVARRSHSVTRRVPRASCSQSGNGYSRIKGTATPPLRLCPTPKGSQSCDAELSGSSETEACEKPYPCDWKARTQRKWHFFLKLEKDNTSGDSARRDKDRVNDRNHVLERESECPLHGTLQSKSETLYTLWLTDNVSSWYMRRWGFSDNREELYPPQKPKGNSDYLINLWGPVWLSGLDCLPPHQGEPGSIPGRVTPGFSQVVIVSEDAAGRRVSSGISRFPPPLHSGAATFLSHFSLIG